MQRIVKRSLFVFSILCVIAILIAHNWEAAAIRLANETNDATASSNKSAASRNKTAKRAQTAPTFNKEVSRIFQNNCQTCHHPGDIAPFSLMTYQEARPWARAIREQVVLRKMPPWKPVPGCGDFRDGRALTQEEINTIVAWVDAGAPEGAPNDLPAPLEFPDGWPLGAPDLVMQPETDYTPPVGQGDVYRCFSVPVENLRGNRQIAALSVKPGNAKIVHHVIAYADPTGISAQLDANESGPGYTCFGGPGFDVNFASLDGSPFIGGWAPGSRGYFAPEGTGIKLENRGRVVIQVHYFPGAQPEADRTALGFYFAKAPVQRQLLVLPLVNQSFVILAGAPNHEVTASFTLPGFVSAKVWSVSPHMHLLGKKIKVELTKPGTTQPDCLINIEDWNFNWQGSYVYKNPVTLAGGARLRLTAIYDNSANNPFQPNNPPQPVRWGERTVDEMALAFIGFTLDQQPLPISSPLLNDVTVDGTGNLVVSGTGFLAGADIEVNGRSLRDTTTAQNNRLSSAELWKVYGAPGQEVNVTALNPDGVRSPAVKFTRTGAAGALATVSAASFSVDHLAPEAIVSAFGTNLATATLVASTTPLPTILGGTSVRVNGVLAPLFFVAPTQVNFLVPAGTLTGSAVVEISSGDNTLARGAINLAAAAPSLFTANANGTGLPAAVATKEGVNFYAVANADGSANPIDAGDTLVLFGTGFRRTPLSSVKVTIGGQDAPALFAGAQGSFAGLDQLNVYVPTGVSGLVDLVVSINGKAANTVKVLVR
jgi:uncharacterized protein (TIGR03437 family)